MDGSGGLVLGGYSGLLSMTSKRQLHLVKSNHKRVFGVSTKNGGGAGDPESTHGHA